MDETVGRTPDRPQPHAAAGRSLLRHVFLMPHGRLALVAGYGHGINLIRPERCARAALDFWAALEQPC